MGCTWFQLNSKPEEGETIVLNFSKDKGDKSISLARNYRYEFTESNWDVPAFAVFQARPKAGQGNESLLFRLEWQHPVCMDHGVWSLWLFCLWDSICITVLRFPDPVDDQAQQNEGGHFFSEFLITFVEFFKKKQIGVILLFLLVYRLGESQLVKLASPFLLDPREADGLGLTTGDLGLIYGTVGMIALSIGGIIGGIAASRKGLKYWLWWMVAAMNLPNLVYVFLSYAMPSSLWIVGASVAVEQFGYGFGFTAYMLYMIYVSEGKHKTAHFALTTGFMALGMMIPGMFSGWLQELIGYQHFFIWVMLCTIPSFLVIPF